MEEKVTFLLNNNDRESNEQIVRSQTSMAAKVPLNDHSKHQLSCGDSSHPSDVQPLGTYRLPLCVKREENNENKMMVKLRKKACRKAYEILRDEHKVSLAESKVLALNLEERISTLYPSFDSAKHYVNVMKVIFAKLRVILPNISRLNLTSRQWQRLALCPWTPSVAVA